MPRAVSLRASREGITSFGATLASGGDLLLVGGRLQLEGQEGSQPFATLYRITSEGVVRERVLRGFQLHGGPSIATDGRRVAVGQPALEGGIGFVSVYRRREQSSTEAGATAEGQRSTPELDLEATLELKPGDPACAGFGQLVAIDQELLVLGQAASVCVYRHSAVGWLAAGTLRPELPYEWNPRLGTSCAVSAGRVLVGNPVEVNGHRAGPGRVFVYRQVGDQMELEAELVGDGIEGGREAEPRHGFGASVYDAGEFVLITAPYELAASGEVRSRVYVYRAQGGALARVATVEVESCRKVSMVADRLFVLGDSLQVYARRGHSFEFLASYPVNGASADEVTMAASATASGALLTLGFPHGHDEHGPGEHAGEVALYFGDQL